MLLSLQMISGCIVLLYNYASQSKVHSTNRNAHSYYKTIETVQIMMYAKNMNACMLQRVRQAYKYTLFYTMYTMGTDIRTQVS